MLSRIAGNCLWLARYLERAENTARLIGVAQNQSLLPEFHRGDARPWRWLVDIAADDTALDKLPTHNPADAALELLIWNRDYASSIWSCLRNVRENTRTARSRLTNAMWEAANTTWIEARALDRDTVLARGIDDTLGWATHRCMWIRATIHDLLEDDTAAIIAAGRAIERCDNTIRVLRAFVPAMKAHGASSNKPGTPGHRLWEAMLSAASVQDWYRKIYPELGDLKSTVELIARYPQQPRSLVLSARKLEKALGRLAPAGATTAQKRAQALVANIDGLAVGALVDDPERLSAMLMQLYGISDAVGYEHCGQEPPTQQQSQS
jgi:uncharacterized alpha-E superfamily protein